MTPPVTLGAFALDYPDPAALGAFYANLLGAEPGFTSDRFAAIKVQGIWVTMHRVENFQPPPWPDAASRGHLDFAVHDDLDAAEARAIELGATKADEQPNPEAWRVLIDPAGHPFCLGPASSYP